jgi:hypothetical protein
MCVASSSMRSDGVPALLVNEDVLLVYNSSKKQGLGTVREEKRFGPDRQDRIEREGSGERTIALKEDLSLIPVFSGQHRSISSARTTLPAVPVKLKDEHFNAQSGTSAVLVHRLTQPVQSQSSPVDANSCMERCPPDAVEALMSRRRLRSFGSRTEVRVRDGGRGGRGL